MQKLYSVTFSKRNFYIAKNDCHKLKLLQIFPIFAILVTRKKTQIYTVVHVIKLWKLQRIITNILIEFSVLFFFFFIFVVTVFLFSLQIKAYIDITVEAIVEVLIHGRNNGQSSLCICLRLLNKI